MTQYSHRPYQALFSTCVSVEISQDHILETLEYFTKKLYSLLQALRSHLRYINRVVT